MTELVNVLGVFVIFCGLFGVLCAVTAWLEKREGERDVSGVRGSWRDVGSRW